MRSYRSLIVSIVVSVGVGVIAAVGVGVVPSLFRPTWHEIEGTTLRYQPIDEVVVQSIYGTSVSKNGTPRKAEAGWALILIDNLSGSDELGVRDKHLLLESGGEPVYLLGDAAMDSTRTQGQLALMKPGGVVAATELSSDDLEAAAAELRGKNMSKQTFDWFVGQVRAMPRGEPTPELSGFFAEVSSNLSRVGQARYDSKARHYTVGGGWDNDSSIPQYDQCYRSALRIYLKSDFRSTAALQAKPVGSPMNYRHVRFGDTTDALPKPVIKARDAEEIDRIVTGMEQIVGQQIPWQFTNAVGRPGKNIWDARGAHIDPWVPLAYLQIGLGEETDLLKDRLMKSNVEYLRKAGQNMTD